MKERVFLAIRRSAQNLARCKLVAGEEVGWPRVTEHALEALLFHILLGGALLKFGRRNGQNQETSPEDQ